MKKHNTIDYIYIYIYIIPSRNNSIIPKHENTPLYIHTYILKYKMNVYLYMYDIINIHI